MVIINNGNKYNDGAKLMMMMMEWKLDPIFLLRSFWFINMSQINYTIEKMAYSSYMRELSSHLSIKEDMHSWAHKNLVSNHVEEGQSWLQEQVIYAIIRHKAPKISILGLSSFVSILKFFILFKQGALHFHLGLANYVVCPGRDQA